MLTRRQRLLQAARAEAVRELGFENYRAGADRGRDLSVTARASVLLALELDVMMDHVSVGFLRAGPKVRTKAQLRARE